MPNKKVNQYRMVASNSNGTDYHEFDFTSAVAALIRATDYLPFEDVRVFNFLAKKLIWEKTKNSRLHAEKLEKLIMAESNAAGRKIRGYKREEYLKDNTIFQVRTLAATESARSPLEITVFENEADAYQYVNLLDRKDYRKIEVHSHLHTATQIRKKVLFSYDINGSPVKKRKPSKKEAANAIK